MDCDDVCCEAYTKEEAGSLLELAFMDRQSLWEDLLRKYDGKLECEGGVDTSFVKWFRHDGREYLAPGRTPPFEVHVDDAVYHDYDPYTRNEGGNGPDGKGEDKLVKSPADFNACITEIVEQLTSSLQTFGWKCPVTTMPAESLAALAKLEGITALHIDASSLRGLVHACECYSPQGAACT